MAALQYLANAIVSEHPGKKPCLYVLGEGGQSLQKASARLQGMFRHSQWQQHVQQRTFAAVSHVPVTGSTASTAAPKPAVSRKKQTAVAALATDISEQKLF